MLARVARRSRFTRKYPALPSRHFGCPVVFASPHDAMVFDRSALDVPFVTAEGGAFARLCEGLEARLGTGEGFSAVVRGRVRAKCPILPMVRPAP